MSRSSIHSYDKSGLARHMIVIVRSIGERTDSACIKLLETEIGNDNVFVVNENPFSVALRKSYEIGMREGRKWTAVIDADILLRSGALQELLTRAESFPGSVFTIQSEMLDKFFGGTRVGGIKLYRTKLLPKAIRFIPDVNVRPETYVIRQMHAIGYYVDITDIVCGLHDFEQYYSDIFRKGFTHGIKHGSLAHILVPYWQRSNREDRDFAVLLAGFLVGQKHAEKLLLDKNEATQEFLKFLKLSKLKEKSKIKKEIDLAYVDKLIRNFVPPEEYYLVKSEIDSWGRPYVPKNPFKRIFVTTVKGRLSLGSTRSH